MSNEPPQWPPTAPPPPPWSPGGGPLPTPPTYGPPQGYGPGPYGAGGPAPYGPPGGYGWQQPQKPPRPAVPIAGWLMIVGAILILVGTFLPWISFGGDSLSAWDLQDLENDSNEGAGYAFLAVVMGGFGITTVAARRVLAVAILAVIFGAFALLAILIDLGDLLDDSDEFLGYSTGAGPWVVILGAAAALAGAIWTLSVRRRW